MNIFKLVFWVPYDHKTERQDVKVTVTCKEMGVITAEFGLFSRGYTARSHLWRPVVEAIREEVRRSLPEGSRLVEMRECDAEQTARLLETMAVSR